MDARAIGAISIAKQGLRVFGASLYLEICTGSHSIAAVWTVAPDRSDRMQYEAFPICQLVLQERRGRERFQHLGPLEKRRGPGRQLKRRALLRLLPERLH